MSELQKALEEYLSVRRTLGFKLREEGISLLKFVLFAKREGASYITTELALRWATQPKGVLPVCWTRRLSMVRLFAQYRSATDRRTEIPPRDLLPHRYHRKPPHLYTDQEVTKLLEAARKLPSAIGLRPQTYSTLFGLLAVTGMRVGEGIGLNRDDVDLTDGVITVREAKFHKSRLIPIHASTRRKVGQYADQRDEIHPKPKDSSFFLSDRGTRLTYEIVRQTFVRISRQIGLRGPSDSHGPRLHDLRHRFAIETLLNWYRTGVDVEQHMPELAAYLGHTHVTGTYWYLSSVPELLRLAAMRLDQIKGSL